MGKNEKGFFPICVSHELKDLTGVPHRDIPGTDLAIAAGYKGEPDASVEEYVFLPDEEIFLAVDKEKPAFRLDSMESLLGLDGLDAENSSGTYVLTAEDGYFGAAVLGYPEELVKAYEMLGAGFYVLPSSIHEVILLPDPKAVGINPEELHQMVSEINQQQVRENERLSNSVYHFDGRDLTSVAGPAAEEESEVKDEIK